MKKNYDIRVTRQGKHISKTRQVVMIKNKPQSRKDCKILCGQRKPHLIPWFPNMLTFEVLNNKTFLKDISKIKLKIWKSCLAWLIILP